MTTARILIVDDEEIIRDSLSFILEKEGHAVETAQNGQEAIDKIEKEPFDIVITDLEMPEVKGIELLEKVQRLTPEAFVLIITAYASIETAIAALRKGASDYIIKPLEFEDIIFRINRLLERRKLELENKLLRQELHHTYDFEAIIGQSPAMQRIYNTVKKVAQTDGTVLITGKSGTGKELIARAIHYNSRRKDNRFVAINTGAIVENLFESELFGHKRGSFTGATHDKEGIFKSASEGSIYLDEVSEIPLHSQVKLLRAIEQKEVIPVGTNFPIKVDVRIIASTNRDLKKEVEKGTFREDLYYRLNVVEINLPSLEERKEDIPLLAQHFMEKYRVEMNKNIKGIDNQVIQVLLNYNWKGEVRELENIIERAVIFCENDYLTVKDLPETLYETVDLDMEKAPKTLKDAVKEFEKIYIRQELDRLTFNKEETAKNLGISVSSLYRKMEELGIDSQK
jgi:DNA-binding NtrC family response regulator